MKYINIHTKLTQKEWIPSLTHYIKYGEHKTGYVLFEGSVAAVHGKTQVDEEVCKELGYEIVETFIPKTKQDKRTLL